MRITRRQVTLKAKKVEEFLSSLSLKRKNMEYLTGVDGRNVEYYLKKILAKENFEVESLKKTFLPVISKFKELGYKYEEIAKDMEDIIKFYEKKERIQDEK